MNGRTVLALSTLILGIYLCAGGSFLSPGRQQVVLLDEQDQQDPDMSVSDAVDSYRSAAIQDAQQASEAAEAKKWLESQKENDATFRRADDLFRISSSLRKAAGAIRAAKARKASVGALDDEWVDLAQDVQYDLREISASRGGIPRGNIFPAFAAPLKTHTINAMGALQLPFQAL
jgi:hypothetical protein